MAKYEPDQQKTSIMAFTWATMKNLFSKPVTKNYPEQPAVYPERSRGHVEIEIDKCISCSLCAKNCPSGCITVDRKEGTWTINRFDCIACGYCTLKCPKNCLQLKPGYQTPMSEKTCESFRKPKPSAGAGTGNASAAATKEKAPAAAAEKGQ